jgi:hypothetical protein
MENDQPDLRALFACESGLTEPEIGLEHAFVLLSFDLAKEARQMAKFVRCPFQKQLQTVLILCVTCIWSHP